jgi:16S rRNA (cytosine1402-N4)-methyltransferase
LPKIFKAITKKPVIASEEELELNSRARSAKLRIAEKL